MKVKDILSYTSGELISGENIDISSFSIDSRKITNDTFFVPLIGENNDGHDYIGKAFENGAIGTFTMRNINPVKGKVIIKVKDTLKALQKLASGIRECNRSKPLIGVTGSVGKTTTRNMIASVLNKEFSVLSTAGNFNNNIGLPLTVSNYKNEDMIVLEMGMNHLGEISFLSDVAKPDVGVIINVGHSHLGNLGSRENILKAKLEILDGMKDNGILVINNDNDLLDKFYLENDISQKIVTFGVNNDSDYMAYDIEVFEDKTCFKVDIKDNTYNFQINLSGKEFVYNALAGIVIGDLYNINPDKIVLGIKDTKEEKMRMNKFDYKGATIIDDTYNASPESIKVGLEGLIALNGKRKIAVLGDILELGNFSKEVHYELGKDVKGFNLDLLILFGNETKNIGVAAKSHGMSENKIVYLDSTEEIYKYLKDYLVSGDNILIKGSRGMRLDKVVEALKNDGEGKI